MSARDDEHCCFICERPFKAGEMVLQDITDGLAHRACFGDDREAFVGDVDTGAPLAEGEPLPSGLPYDPADFVDPAPIEREVSSERVSALLPVDGLEVVMELNRIIAEEAEDFADAAGHAIEAGERPDLWDREVEVAVHTLSKASSVIAGLKAEVADLRDEWQAEYDARLAANTTRRAAEARISSLEQKEAKRLAHIQKLERRIRNQRRANRDNWQIVEARGNWLGSPRSRAQLVRLMGANREASNRLFALEGQNKRLREALQGVMKEETFSLHVGYDNATGGGNFVYADVIRTDSDAFLAARETLEDHNG